MLPVCVDLLENLNGVSVSHSISSTLHRQMHMDDFSYHQSTPGWPSPIDPNIVQSPQTPAELPASYPSDLKPVPSSFRSPSEPSRYGEGIGRDDVRYLRKQAAEVAAVKPKKGLHGEVKAFTIVPDENPLSATQPKYPIQDQNLHHVSGSTLNNHFPGQTVHANQHIKGGTWKYGLCDCGDMSVCCTGVWCPCIVYGKTQYRLSQRSERKDPSDMIGYSTFNGSCAAFAVLCGCNLVLAAIQHSRLRNTYDIPGSIGTDFVRACCCCCCTLSQDEKEIKYRETRVRKPSVTTATVQYRSPDHMDFAPPPT